jgi:N-acetylglucosaminyldiphosphoundecaprenol N-acetyl-beta-D-mannosaminyltransferase
MNASSVLRRPAPPRFRVHETYVHAVNPASVGELIADYLEDGGVHQIVTANMDFLRIAREQPAFNDVINSARLTVPDGRPLVWMARYLGFSDCDRVTGPDVMEAAARLSAERGYRLFLLGGAAGVADLAKEALEALVPGVQICGTYSPPASDYPFPAALDAEVSERVLAARPDVLFVGFGCPKQDLWIRDHMDQLGVSLSVGIGGSYNFFSGLVPRAPLRLQRWGLEWVYRLYREPRRLWRRYLLEDIPFAVRVVAAEAQRRAGLRRTPVISIDT